MVPIAGVEAIENNGIAKRTRQSENCHNQMTGGMQHTTGWMAIEREAQANSETKRKGRIANNQEGLIEVYCLSLHCTNCH